MPEVTLRKLGLTTSVALASLGTIKLYMPPYFHWMAMCVFLILTVASAKHNIKHCSKYVDIRSFAPWVVFVIGIALAAGVNDLSQEDILFSLGTIGQLFILSLILFLLMTVVPSFQEAESAFFAALQVCALGFAISLLLDGWLLTYADGRVAWKWAWAGVFWKAGAYALPFAVWKMLTSPSWRQVPILTLALLVIALDGSRTGLLATAAILTFSALIYAALNPGWKWLTGFAVCVSAALVTFFLLQPMFSRLIGGTLGDRALASVWLTLLLSAALLAKYTRVSRLQFWVLGCAVACLVLVWGAGSVTSVIPTASPAETEFQSGTTQTSGGIATVAVERLLSEDQTRLRMLSVALERLSEGFPIGLGLGTTVDSAGGAEVMHVHNTYLQLLSDIGIIGAIGYLSIFGYFFWRFLPLSGKYKNQATPLLAIAAVYLLQGMFAPFSNELSEWLPVLLAFATISGLEHQEGMKSA